MNTRTVIFSLALVSVLVASAQAHSAAYLKIEGIKGEATESTGKRQHRPLKAIKHLDKASPVLQEAADKGKVKTGAERPSPISTSAGGGGGAGKVKFDRFGVK